MKPHHPPSFFRTLRLWPLGLGLALLLTFFWTGQSLAQSLRSIHTIQIQQSYQVSLNTAWVIFCSCLVFVMGIGFTLINMGFCRSKNAVNLLTQNLLTLALTVLLFWGVGFALMFGTGTPLFGTQGFWLMGLDNSPLTGLDYQGIFASLGWASLPLQTKFFFQALLAAIAVGIVAGAVAERVHFLAFLLFSVFFLIFIYPVVGHWVWGDGWLGQGGFWDYGGAMVIHVVGGWAAFVGTVLIGPRLGKYRRGESFALPAHNLPLAALGCLAVWLGWFGFNGGAGLSANPAVITHVLLVTNLAAATGGISALAMAWFYFGKPDLSVMINGILGGLVSITAVCRFVSLGWAGLIGAIAGVLVVLAIDFFDRLEIDDPVGVLPVHLVCGLWGTLAVALFALGPDNKLGNDFILYSLGPSQGLLLGGGLMALKQLLIQLLGIASVSFLVLLFSWFGWMVLDVTVGLRVSAEAELRGLDLSEHGLTAYSGFILKQDSLSPNPSKPQGLLPPW